jgi:competence protein ComEA
LERCFFMKQILLQYKHFLIPTIIISSLILFFLSNKDESESSTLFEPIQPLEEQSTEQIDSPAIETPQSIYVDVKGAVRAPGLYELSENERILDAIQLAGGYTEEANTNAINHAQKVEDEMVIYVPKIGEEVTELTETLTVTASSDSKNSNGKINLNKASADELTSLPGIGPQKAQAIIAYRDENGRFRSIEELKNVSGIGEKTFEKLKELIEV